MSPLSIRMSWPGLPLRWSAALPLLCLALLLLPWCAALPARADEESRPSSHVELVKADSTWRFMDDLTQEKAAWVQQRALTEQGATMIGRQTFAFNKDTETFVLVDAYTLKADGSRIAVGPDRVVRQSGVVAGGAGVGWPGVEVRQVTFPDVKKGDSVVWQMRHTTTRTMLPGWAHAFAFLAPSLDVLDDHLRIEAPQALHLNVFSEGFEVRKTIEGRTDVWLLEGHNRATAVEPNAADSVRGMPRVYASTIPTYEEWALSFAKPTFDKVVVTPAVQKLVAEIVPDGAVSERDRARAVAEWIRHNIRYAAVFVGVGGYLPNAVDDILRNRYGDCKDHVLLLITLLRAVGVEASVALLNTQNEYQLPELPVGVSHVIGYVPALDLFVDTTAKSIPFGALPWVDADKPVLVASVDTARSMRTPAFKAQDDSQVVRSVWRIDREGNASATVAVESSGYAGTALQDRLEKIDAETGGADAVRKILQSSRLDGGGSLSHPPVSRDSQRQSATFRVDQVRHLLGDPAAGSLAVPPRLNLPLYIVNQMGDYTAPARRTPMLCTPKRVREEFELTLDPAFHVLRAPQNLSEAGPDGISFNAEYRLEGNRLVGSRELVLDHGRHVCDPAQYAARRETMQRIARHLRTPLLYSQ